MNRGGEVTLPSGEQQGQKERGLRRGTVTKGSTSTRQRERVLRVDGYIVGQEERQSGGNNVGGKEERLKRKEQ